MRDALAFLTVLPAGRRTGAPGRAAIAAFPLAGLLVGAMWWGAGWVGTRVWGPAVGAALALAVDLVVTGGLHLDGLADEADGVACRLPPAEALAVMHQGPVGAIGASAAAVVLLLRFALLSTAFMGPGGSHAAAVIAAPAAGRFAMVWTMARSRRQPADRATADRAHGAHRAHGGPRPLSLASEIREGARGLPLAVSAAVALTAGYLLAGPRGVGGLVCACLVAAVNARLARSRLGGVTGDVIGAGGLLGETAMLAAVAAHL